MTAGAFDRTANGELRRVRDEAERRRARRSCTRRGSAARTTSCPRTVKVDGAGNAYVGGSTRSTGFPTTPGAFDTTHSGGAFDERFDLFATKLNPAGSALVYSTFIGGSHNDFGDRLRDRRAPATPTSSAARSRRTSRAPGVRVSKLEAPTGSALVYSRSVAGAGASPRSPTATRGSAAQPARTARRRPTRSTRSSTAAPSTRTWPSSTPPARSCSRASSAARSRRRPPTSRSAAATSTSPATPTRRTSPTTPGAFDRMWAGDPLIFWGDAFVAKVDVDAHRAARAVAGARAGRTGAGVSPADGAVVAPPVTFDWSDVSGAISYTIQVDEISEFGAPLILSATTSASTVHDQRAARRQLVLARAGVNRRATGRVVGGPHDHRAVDPAAPAAAGAGRRDAGEPGRRRVGGAAVHVRLERRGRRGLVRDRGRRQLDFARSCGPRRRRRRRSRPTRCPNGTLFWRVRAFNDDGVGRARTRRSAPCRVGTAAGPLAGADARSAPSNDARFSPGQSITFDWSDVAGAGGYTIQIDDSQSFSAPLDRERDRRGSSVHRRARCRRGGCGGACARTTAARGRQCGESKCATDRDRHQDERARRRRRRSTHRDERDRGGDPRGPVEQADARRRRGDVDGDERGVRRADQIVEAEDIDRQRREQRGGDEREHRQRVARTREQRRRVVPAPRRASPPPRRRCSSSPSSAAPRAPR